MNGILGINNKNVFNVKQPTIDMAGWWLGSVDRDAKGHAVFADVIYSVRAAVRQLSQYQVRDGKKTLTEMFQIYAPISDGNDPDSYAKYVASKVGIQADTRLLLFFENGMVANWPFLISTLRGMLGMEIFDGFDLAEETLRAGIAFYECDFVK